MFIYKDNIVRKNGVDAIATLKIAMYEMVMKDITSLKIFM